MSDVKEFECVALTHTDRRRRHQPSYPLLQGADNRHFPLSMCVLALSRSALDLGALVFLCHHFIYGFTCGAANANGPGDWSRIRLL